ncbi:nuclear protein localization protein 4 homolog isoform X4 [Porites lutea]|uniref:nuclear protein localization protein 4 homolog isoform X4 n=1 Tax=Porites lutea TaxID=51062 RepID=UPI003CC6D269
MSQIIVRVQSREGTKRIKCSTTESISSFLSKISKELSLPRGGWTLYKERNKTGEIKNSTRKTLNSFGVKHGDMLFLSQEISATVNDTSEASSFPLSTSTTAAPIASSSVKEDEIDIFLSKQDGLIHRGRDPQLCHHNPNSKCIHCVPLEPYDEEYLKNHQPPIKHMSFHAFLKKLGQGTERGKFTVLEDTSCRIKPGCTEHPPWPGGICTKCQPSAITLKRQTYRHVDNILFENPFIVEPFLNYWRKTGNQRLGFLYGRYEHHKDVPLGIRASVAAIYEPPQEGTPDSIKLLSDPNEEVIDKLAADLGLQRVGWIFTDLVADDVRKGTVKHLRDINTFFLTAEECILAGHLQNLYPSPCILSSSGKFGSKFTTVVVSGNMDNQVGFDGFQVSNQCMALVRDECLVPTIDEPGLGYIRESSSDQYVPDVFYKVPAAFPVESQFTFTNQSEGEPFPLENRSSMGELQGHLEELCEAVKNKDSFAARRWSKGEQWSTVIQLMQAANAPSPEPHGSHDVDMMDASQSPSGASWTCKHCTFINQHGHENCDMCGLPQR